MIADFGTGAVRKHLMKFRISSHFFQLLAKNAVAKKLGLIAVVHEVASDVHLLLTSL